MTAVPAPTLTGRLLWAGVFTLVLIWSAIDPRDRMTWWLEVAPALAAVAVLGATSHRFPLTTMSYVLILIHSIILMVGGHFTYAEVPAFDWLAQVMGWERNNYDKVGHLAQGFVPAILAREILIRNGVVTKRGWLSFLVVCVALAISAFYELIEWWVAVLAGASSEAFLGTQGYEWDTQSDMALALIGAVAALALLGRWHDRQLGRTRGAGAPSAA